MNRIGIIGDMDSILGFKSFGLEIFRADAPEEAAGHLQRMANDGFAVIFITEDLAEKIASEIEKFNDSILPAVIPVPGIGGSSGTGLAAMKKWAEKAVGADILFKEG